MLVEVLAELGAGQIRERFIHDPKELVHGETTGRRITISPAVALCDTVLHECLHRLRPAWSESYVRNRTSWLMRRMSEEQIEQVYREYGRRVAKRRPSQVRPRPVSNAHD